MKVGTKLSVESLEVDFGEADRLRDDLAARGVLLEDGPGGTRWKRK